MALRACRQCGEKISTDAKACPRCGKDRPTYAPAGRPSWLLVILGVFAILVLIISLGDLTKSVPDSSAADSSSVAAQIRAGDSTMAIKFFEHPDLSNSGALLQADRAMRTTGLSRVADATLVSAYNRIHPHAVDIRLDSATALLRKTQKRGPAPALAKVQLDEISEPMTAHQRDRRVALNAKLKTAFAAAAVEGRKAAAQTLAETRRKYAKQLESKYLDDNMDVTVTTKGANATTLRIKWILVSRVLVHQFSKNADLFQNLRDIGFKRLELTDGYDEEWSWTL